MSEIRKVIPDSAWLASCKAKQEDLLIADPWNDGLCKKSGLVNYYYISAFMETLHIAAASREYSEIHGLLVAYLAAKESYDLFCVLRGWIEKYLSRECHVAFWQTADIPDIRRLMTPDECLSYCVTRHGQSWPVNDR